tara:strand:- start:13024 stop:13671 length:648 start_codon:yes stop_codon:yes gene_type:complete
MPFCLGTTLPSSGSISLNQIHVESGGTSGSTINFNNQRIRNLTGFKKNTAGAKSFSQCHGAYLDGHPNTSTLNGQTVLARKCWDQHVGQNQNGVGTKERAYAAGNANGGSSSGASTSYANSTTVIQYIAIALWIDEGEGDYDFDGWIAAIAPGGSATIRANGSHTFSNSNLAKLVVYANGSEASSWDSEGPFDVGTNYGGSNFGGTIYPWGITVD